VTGAGRSGFARSRRHPRASGPSALADAQRAGVDSSLQILEGLHARWAYLLRSLGPDEFERSFYHPESREIVPLGRALAYYVWHGRHHTAQIEWVRKHKLTVG
jgi:DinB family protein